MDDLTPQECDDIRAFVNNEDGSYPMLADLPAWWDTTDPDARAPELPNYSGACRTDCILHELVLYQPMGLGRFKPAVGYSPRPPRAAPRST